MLNQTVIIGRIVRDLEVHETENGNKVAQLTLAVPRGFKNMDGEYETDYIPCVLWRGVAENTAEYCKKGDLVGIKGRIQTSQYEQDDEVKYVTEVVAEKVTFLSTRRPEADN